MTDKILNPSEKLPDISEPLFRKCQHTRSVANNASYDISAYCGDEGGMFAVIKFGNIERIHICEIEIVGKSKKPGA